MKRIFVPCLGVFALASILACPLYVRASPIPAKSLSIDCASVQPLDSFAAASQGSASLRINFAQVVDTYWLYTGLIEGKPHNNTRVHETYKQLSYKTSYSQIPPTLYEVQQIKTEYYLPGFGWAHLGTLEKWRCNYKTW